LIMIGISVFTRRVFDGIDHQIEEQARKWVSGGNGV